MHTSLLFSSEEQYTLDDFVDAKSFQAQDFWTQFVLKNYGIYNITKLVKKGVTYYVINSS